MNSETNSQGAGTSPRLRVQNVPIKITNHGTTADNLRVAGSFGRPDQQWTDWPGAAVQDRTLLQTLVDLGQAILPRAIVGRHEPHSSGASAVLRSPRPRTECHACHSRPCRTRALPRGGGAREPAPSASGPDREAAQYSREEPCPSAQDWRRTATQAPVRRAREATCAVAPAATTIPATTAAAAARCLGLDASEHTAHADEYDSAHAWWTAQPATRADQRYHSHPPLQRRQGLVRRVWRGTSTRARAVAADVGSLPSIIAAPRDALAKVCGARGAPDPQVPGSG